MKMPGIESVIRNVFECLKVINDLEEPSVNEVANTLKWSYLKTRTFMKALENTGLIKMKWIPGPPQRFIITLTEKGKCILNCVEGSLRE